jgi:hypothetical protein
MREWQRETKSCAWEAIPAAALADYCEQYGCENLSADLRACVETVSTPLRRRRLPGGPHVSRIVIAVTSNYLVSAALTDGGQPVIAARLRDVEVRDYASTPESKLLEDSGLSVLGVRLGGTLRESWFLPLDEGADANALREQLASAIAPANPR